MAFCLILQDPAGARELLRELLGEGYDAALVHANLIAVELGLGDPIRARHHAEIALEMLGGGARARDVWL